jgi:hypothetical protein
MPVAIPSPLTRLLASARWACDACGQNIDPLFEHVDLALCAACRPSNAALSAQLATAERAVDAALATQRGGHRGLSGGPTEGQLRALADARRALSAAALLRRPAHLVPPPETQPPAITGGVDVYCWHCDSRLNVWVHLEPGSGVTIGCPTCRGYTTVRGETPYRRRTIRPLSPEEIVQRRRRGFL